MNRGLSRTFGCLIGIGVVWSVLSLNGRSGAAPQPAPQPFENAVAQRHQMIQELQEIKSLLREQNLLLREVLGKNAVHGKSTK